MLGRIFLIGVLVIGGYGIYRIADQWKSWNTPSPKVVTEEPALPGIVRQQTAPLVPDPPTKTSPETLAVGAMVQGHGIHVIQFGMVKPGEELPCGAVLISWDNAKIYAKHGATSVTIRIKRPLEIMAETAPEPVKPHQDDQVGIAALASFGG